MYARETCEFMFVPLITGKMADRTMFPQAFEALLADYGFTLEQYEESPERMDACLPAEILHYGVPERCCRVDFTFDWSDFAAYEKLVETYARCTLGGWSPVNIAFVEGDSGPAIRFNDSSGEVRIPIKGEGDALCEDFERSLRTHAEGQVSDHAFLSIATDPEAGIVWLHWFKDHFVPAFERRINNLKSMRSEHRIRVRNGVRVKHDNYGAGIVVEYDAEHGLNLVKFETVDGKLKAAELTDPALSLD